MLRRSCLLLLAAVATLGCGGDPNGPQRVSGRVTFRGEPLDQGVIAFVDPSNSVQAGGALVRDGKYDIPAEHGLTPGKYQVTISSPSGSSVTPEEYAAGKTAMTSQERIAAKYNSESTLEAEVTAGGTNQFDFEVD